MKNRIALLAAMAALIGVTAAAQPGGGMMYGPRMGGPMMGGPLGSWMGNGDYAREARAILDEWEDQSPAQLTFGEIETLAGELSIPLQKAAYVRKSAFASLLMPGAGQFMNRDPLSGSLFVLGDLAITAGTLVGTYFLLPEEVRFDRLDYGSTGIAEIKSTWKSALGGMTLGESFAVLGVMTGGFVVERVFAHFSARHAGELARERVAAGEVSFRPKPALIFGPGVFGFGMSFAH